MEIASKDLEGLPVFSLEEGERLGQVKSLVIDAEKRAVIAITVGIRRMFQEEKVIPYFKIHHIGPEALLLSTSKDLEKQANLPQMVKLINHPLHICGNRVMTEEGVTLGRVREFFADIKTGALTSLEMSGSILDGIWKGRATIPADQIIVFGADAIIVKNELTPPLQKKPHADPEPKVRSYSVKEGMNKAFSSLRSRSKDIKGKTKDIKINFLKKEGDAKRSVIFPEISPVIEEPEKEAARKPNAELKTASVPEPELPAAKAGIVYQNKKSESVK